MENLIDVYNYIRAAADIKALSAYSFLHYERLRHNDLRSCFEFLQKVFLGLMYPFSCVLWARQIARYLPHHRSENASKTHPKSSHDKFKTASKFSTHYEQ